MASFSDDFDYTGSLGDNGYTLIGFDPAISANGSIATATGIGSFALVELDSNECSASVTVDATGVDYASLTICCPSDGGYSFPQASGYMIELVNVGDWYFRLFRNRSEVISYTPLGVAFPAELGLAHDGAGNVDIYVDDVLIDTYEDGSPLTNTWAGFGGPSGADFDLFDAADLGGETPIDLIVADVTVAAALDAVALTQVHVLAVADATVAVALEGVVLTQVHTLVVADVASAAVLDGVTLTQVHALAVADAGVDVVIDAVALTQVHELVVADAAVATGIDEVTLSVDGIPLTVANLASETVVDAVTLDQVHNLTVTDVAVDATIDLVALTQLHVLTVADLAVAVVVDQVTLINPSLAPSLTGLRTTDSRDRIRSTDSLNPARTTVAVDRERVTT